MHHRISGQLRLIPTLIPQRSVHCRNVSILGGCAVVAVINPCVFQLFVTLSYLYLRTVLRCVNEFLFMRSCVRNLVCLVTDGRGILS